jgi:hypothetical protein
MIARYIKIVFSLFLVYAPLLPQNISHDLSVINVEVPVRAYHGGKFVTDMMLNDFAVFENGIPQKPLALYLVEGGVVERAQGPARLAPLVSKRHFILCFEMDEYPAELSTALDYFFETVLLPGDELYIVTPENSLKLKKESWERIPRAEFAEQCRSRLKRDLVLGARKLRNLILDLRMLAEFQKEGSESVRLEMESVLEQILSLKEFDYQHLEGLSTFIKSLDGRKHIYLFYQKEEYILPMKVSEGIHSRPIAFDPNKIRRAFGDPSVTAHLLYLTRTNSMAQGIEMKTQEDGGRLLSSMRENYQKISLGGELYQIFREAASVSGGIVDSSFNAEALMKRASDSSARYYLLYYQPRGTTNQREYRTIKVESKRKGVSLSHREGYFIRE